MAKTLVAALAAVAFLLPLVPIAAAQAPSIDLDVQDLPEDIIIDPEGSRSTEYIGARDDLDVIRVKQRVDGEDIVLELVFAGAPGEANAYLTGTARMGDSVGSGALFGVRWDAQGKPPAKTKVSYTVGSVQDRDATIETSGSSFVMRMPLPPEAKCLDLFTTLSVRTSDAEYTEVIAPDVNTCDGVDLLDGARGDCPAAPAPSGKDPVVADFADEEDDVHAITIYGQQGDKLDKPNYDIRRVTSERQGDRIVQTVTVGAARNATDEIKLRLVNRLDGDRGGDGEAAYALTALYWRFNNGSQQDRSHGELLQDDDTVNFPTELELGETTFTFSWCASLIPDDARCFGIEVIAERPAYFGTGIRDVARPAIDPCAGAGTVTPTSPAGEEPTEEEPTDEQPVDGEEPTDEETGEGSAESPGVSVLALLAALGALALFRRR